MSEEFSPFGADATAPINGARGEVAVKGGIGGVPLTIAVTFAGLAKLSRMAGVDSYDELARKLVGFHPWVTACAIRCLTVDPAGPEAVAATVNRALAGLSTADEPAWAAAIIAALEAHIKQGKARRGEAPPSLADEVAAVEAAMGEDAGAAPLGKSGRPS